MPVNVNVPYQVTIAVDGSVTIQSVDAQEYSLAAKHAQFNGFLVDDILNAFHVTSNSEFPSAANVSVDMSDNAVVKSAFIAALANQLKTALLSDTSLLNVATSSASLDDYLMDWANKEIVKQLSANGIASALEAEGLKGMAHTGFNADLTDGATAMFDGLATIAPTVRAVIATQIPNTRWMTAFNDAGEVLDSKLPLYDGGDSMTFQFVITQNFVVSEEAVNAGESSGFFIPGASPPIGVLNSGNASGVAPLNNVLGQYSVDSRTINLVLTRPSPANYPAVRDEVSAPVAPSTEDRDDAATAVTTALTGPAGYNVKAAAAQAAYVAWDAENKKKIASDLAADKAAAAVSVYDASVIVQTNALAAAGDLKAGPLHDAAQRAIEATKQALADKVELESRAATALAALAAAPNNLAFLYGASKAASKAQAEAYKAWTAAQKLAAEEEDKYQAAKDTYDNLMASRLALKESANRAAQKALDQWTGLSGEAVALSTELETARGTANTKNGLWRGKVTARDGAQTTYNGNKSETNAQALALAQIQETEAEEAYVAAVAAFDVKRGETLAIIDKANTALATYISANNLSDFHVSRTSPASPADLFDAVVSAAAYVAPA